MSIGNLIFWKLIMDGDVLCPETFIKDIKRSLILQLVLMNTWII